VEEFASLMDLPGTSWCSASSTGATTDFIAFLPRNDTNAYFRLTFGLEVVEFPDPNLNREITSAIGSKRGPTNEIYDIELTGITSLDLQWQSISNLTGMESVLDLTYLNLHGNSVSDVGPLAGLIGLQDLRLGYDAGAGNSVSNLTPLAGLTNMTELWLHDIDVADLSPLTGMGKVWNLQLAGNSICDVEPLGVMTNLIMLHLGDNQITNAAPLGSLTRLGGLGLIGNSITNIDFLTNLTGMTTLMLGDNQIVDIDPLAGLTNLIELGLENNPVTNISALITNAQIGGLGPGESADLSGTPITDTNQVTALRSYGVNVEWP